MRIALALSLAGAVALGSRDARAESAEAQVERLANEAVNAYKGADYRRAVELLQRAYDIRQVPALLYNMAKAYDKLGDVDHAYEAYRHYVDSAAADPKLKAKAEARIVALEEVRRKKAAEAKPPEPPKPVEVAPPEPQRPPAETIEAARVRVHDDFVRRRHRARLVAIGAGGATVALAAVALGLSVNALTLEHQFNATTSPDVKARDKSDATVRAGVADGFWAAAAVGAAVAGYYLWAGYRKEPPSLAVAPVVTPTGGALVVDGRF